MSPLSDIPQPVAKGPYVVSVKAEATAKRMIYSIQALSPDQLSLPTEDDEEYDGAVAVDMAEKLDRNPMKLIYVPHVLNWWVPSFVY